MKRQLVFALLLLLAGLLVLGSWLADRKLKELRHPGLSRFVKQLVTNYPASFQVEPAELHIRVEQRDLDRLQEIVDEARARGVIMPEGRDYVPADIIAGDDSFKARIRIKGKMTDHVKGSKWSFRVQARKDGGFLGMQRFSLQHPGTRNYLTDWFFHQLMKGEGAIALRYGFIRLHFNNEDLGIYAYEEHFGPELLEHNGRSPGPLFRFDPSLFWEHRLNTMNKLRIDEPYAAFQAAAVDAFGTGDLARDSATRAVFEEAVSLMEAFRRGHIPAAQVFDADRIGARHAILDLVGGHHSLDWSDVKFYYDPVLRRIEPVAYESFSAYPIRSLAGSHRYVGYTDPGMDLHDAYFNDPDIFRAYVRHLERVSRKSYLDSAFAVLAPALDSASAIVYQEFPYKELDRSIYYHNQRVIRKLLEVPKGFHAYAHEQRNDTLAVTAIPIEGFPIEVHGLVANDGSLIPPIGAAIIPVRRTGYPGVPMAIRFHVPDSLSTPRARDRQIAYSVLGSSVRRQLEVFVHRFSDGVTSVARSEASAPDMRTWPFVAVEEEARIVHLRPGRWTLDQDLVIPAGYRVKGTTPLRFDLVKGARIISRSPVELIGFPDNPVVLSSSDRSGGGVLVYEASGLSKWEHVRSEGFGRSEVQGASIIFQDSDLELMNCMLGEDRARDLLHIIRGSTLLSGGMLVGGRDQLTTVHARVGITRTEFLGGGDKGIVVHGGQATLKDVTIDGAVSGGIKLDTHAELKGQGTIIRTDGPGIRCSEGSRMELDRGSIETPVLGIDVKDARLRYGPSTVKLQGVHIEAGQGALSVGAGNTVMVDGSKVEDSATPPQP